MVTVKNVGCGFECESCHGEIEVGIRGLGFWEEVGFRNAEFSSFGTQLCSFDPGT